MNAANAAAPTPPAATTPSAAPPPPPEPAEALDCATTALAVAELPPVLVAALYAARGSSLPWGAGGAAGAAGASSSAGAGAGSSAGAGAGSSAEEEAGSSSSASAGSAAANATGRATIAAMCSRRVRRARSARSSVAARATTEERRGSGAARAAFAARRARGAVVAAEAAERELTTACMVALRSEERARDRGGHETEQRRVDRRRTWPAHLRRARREPSNDGSRAVVVVFVGERVMTWHRISAVFKDWQGCVETTDFSIAMLTGIAFAFSRIANRCRCAFVRPEQLGFSNAGAPLR